MNYRNKLLVVTLFAGLVLLPGCFDFVSIEQPYSLQPDERFMVNIEVAVWADGYSYSPRFAMLLPSGWTLPGNSFQCTGVYHHEIVFDPNAAQAVEEQNPPPEGYYWWVGAGELQEEPEDGSAFAEILIQTNELTGLFSLDYLIGSGGCCDEDTRRRHLIEVVDAYTPRELRAS